jgi:hypothetical protein
MKKKKTKRFKGEVLSGHKQKAIEVPFDPAQQWKIEAQALWRGRRGFRVKAKIKGRSFESAIVPRQKTFYLLIDDDLKLTEGTSVQVTVEPAA